MERIYYKIDGRIYLLGGKDIVSFENPNSNNYGDILEVFELFDITTEMLDGDSYSIYACFLDHLELATKEEAKKEDEFLNKLGESYSKFIL